MFLIRAIKIVFNTSIYDLTHVEQDIKIQSIYFSLIKKKILARFPGVIFAKKKKSSCLPGENVSVMKSVSNIFLRLAQAESRCHWQKDSIDFNISVSWFYQQWQQITSLFWCLSPGLSLSYKMKPADNDNVCSWNPAHWNCQGPTSMSVHASNQFNICIRQKMQIA